MSSHLQHRLSETDVGDQRITPALQRAGWTLERHILREYTLRPGRVVVRGQSRIVTRVTALRRLCTDLRQRLAERQSVQARLAETLVDSVTA